MGKKKELKKAELLKKQEDEKIRLEKLAQTERDKRKPCFCHNSYPCEYLMCRSP
jgi:hypothetical protein